jgi:hypothetical protein
MLQYGYSLPLKDSSKGRLNGLGVDVGLTALVGVTMATILVLIVGSNGNGKRKPA